MAHVRQLSSVAGGRGQIQGRHAGMSSLRNTLSNLCLLCPSGIRYRSRLRGVLQSDHPPRRPAARRPARLPPPLGMFYFGYPNDNVRLVPMKDSPVLQRVGISRKCADDGGDAEGPDAVVWAGGAEEDRGWSRGGGFGGRGREALQLG